jgi:hypothetical protein
MCVFNILGFINGYPTWRIIGTLHALEHGLGWHKATTEPALFA